MPSSRGERLLSLALILIPAALLLRGIVNYAPAQVDFTPVWLAGRMWASGHDPYGDQFVAIGRTLYPDPESQPHGWFYPPQWWGICVLLARLPLERAAALWLALNLAALALSIAILWRASDQLRVRPPLWLKAGLVAYLLTAEGTKGALLLGQTAILLLLAFALVLGAVAGLGRWMAAAGLTILFLKPQVGGVVALILLLGGGMWRALVVAVAISVVAALPPLVAFGAVHTVAAWLGQIGRYMTMGRNLPAELVGLVQLTSIAGVPTVLLVPFALMLFAGLRRLLPATERQDPRLFWTLMLAVLAAVLPLHAYDLPFAAALLLVAWPVNGGAAFFWSGLALLHRARTLGALVAPELAVNVSGARIASIGALLLLAGAAMAIREARQKAPPVT
jgi:hypothetical protein